MIKDVVSKSPIIFKVLLEKTFKLSLYHWVPNFGVIFILISLLYYCSIEKQKKKDLVRTVNFSGFEIGFILLAKAIAF